MRKLICLALIAMTFSGCGVVKGLVEPGYWARVKKQEADERYARRHPVRVEWYDRQDNNWAFYTGFGTWFCETFLTFTRGASVGTYAYSTYRDAVRRDKEANKKG
jgi:uncharacterized protein YceK